MFQFVVISSLLVICLALDNGGNNFGNRGGFGGNMQMGGYGGGSTARAVPTFTTNTGPRMTTNFVANPVSNTPSFATPSFTSNTDINTQTSTGFSNTGVATAFNPNIGGEKIPVNDNQIVRGAVQSSSSFEVRPVAIQNTAVQPRIVEFDGGSAAVKLLFKSGSGRVQVEQSHIGSTNQEPEFTQTEEQPTRLVHEVRKPIIQEVREIIIPFRKVVQEVQPAREEVKTIVSQGQGGGVSNVGVGVGVGTSGGSTVNNNNNGFVNTGNSGFNGGSTGVAVTSTNTNTNTNTGNFGGGNFGNNGGGYGGGFFGTSNNNNGFNGFGSNGGGGHQHNNNMGYGGISSHNNGGRFSGRNPTSSFIPRNSGSFGYRS